MMHRWLDFILLHGAICVYSIHTIVAKFVSGMPFPSLNFFGFFMLEFSILGFYAACWQKILHRFELSVAYMNKAAVLVWSLIWNYLFFHDIISPAKVLGIGMVLCGIIILNSRSFNEVRTKS